ncbi:MAG TPA: response regulator transcription factor [Anaerolineales bacterium]|nr:response regulator transcription factor [Anaerolineales bacterium]
MKTGGRILIVDDEASLRQMMARVLQRAGYEVTTAANGKDGLALASEQLFDLLYLDIRMPDMNGLEVLKTVHTKFPDLPVVLFTAQPDLHSALEALRRGATDYLLKPLKPQTVIDRTQAILASKQEERRKRELQRQIETLQAELSSLQGPKGAAADSKGQQSLAADDRFLKRGLLTLDLLARRVTMNERAVSLPTASFDYLVVLARHAPQVVDYQTLVSEAQGYETDTREAQELSRWHVHHIRQVIEPDMRNPIYVINVRGTGYRLAMN